MSEQEEYVEDEEVEGGEEEIVYRYGQEPIIKKKTKDEPRYDETNEAIAAGRRYAELSNKDNRRKVLS